MPNSDGSKKIPISGLRFILWRRLYFTGARRSMNHPRQNVHLETGVFYDTVRYPAGNCCGFTLLEVLVALSMIAIVVVSVMRLQGQSISLNETARFYSVAPFLAQAKMAEVKFDPAAFEAGGSGEFDESSPGYKWTVNTEKKEISLREKSPMPFSAVTVMVTLEPAGLKYALSEYLHEGTAGEDIGEKDSKEKDKTGKESSQKGTTDKNSAQKSSENNGEESSASENTFGDSNEAPEF